MLSLLMTLSLLLALPYFALAQARVVTAPPIPAAPGWYELANTQLRPHCPPDMSHGTQGCEAVVNAWGGGLFDTKRNRLVMWGGGHMDYFGNELYALNVTTLTVERLTDPGKPLAPVAPCQEAIVNGTQPNSRHTYDGLTYLPQVDKLWSWGGGLACQAGSTAGSWFYDFDTKQWESVTPQGTAPTYLIVATAYDPNTRLVFLHDRYYLHSYNVESNTFTRLGPGTQTRDIYTVGVIDPVTKQFFLFGGGDALMYDIGPGSTYTPIPFPTTGGEWIVNTTYPGLAYDPGSQRIIGWYEGDTVYSLDTSTRVWTPITYPGGPGARSGTGTFKRFSYSAASGVFVVVNSVDRNAFALRLASGTTPPVPPPLPPTPLPNVFPLGDLIHDGPATPEQLSLLLPVTGNLPQSATASVRYKPTASPTWAIGHPLYRMQPHVSEATPHGGRSPDAFAWPIIDLVPGTSYDVEVTVTSGAVTDLKTASFTTRALPGPSGPPNKTITAGSSSATIQAAFHALQPGDVLQFQDGTYAVDTLILDRSGTAAQPITIRGASRTGVILSDPYGTILSLQHASHVILEHMTLQGLGEDRGFVSSWGIIFFSGASPQTRVTVRNITIRGVDIGIKADAEITEFLAYDNSLLGNNTWTPAMLTTSSTWDDDGINIPGVGNCAFNNTLSGFGDTFALANNQGGTRAIGVHFYRNDVLMTGDDLFEADDGNRNVTFYDNRSRNAMTFVSLDPLYGGPLLVARNISINTGRVPFKWNSRNSGQFLYNNTIIRTTGKHWLDGNGSAEAGWYQSSNGSQFSYGYQNNILIYHGVGSQTIRIDNTGHSPIDFTHNSWFPDTLFQWYDGSYSTLATTYSRLPATGAVFSSSTKRHEQDNITVSNPWTATITLGPDYLTEIKTPYTPTLAAGTAPKNSGIIIANITDGYSGAAPDRGAIIAGRAIPRYGDRSSAPVPPPPPPAEDVPGMFVQQLYSDKTWLRCVASGGEAKAALTWVKSLPAPKLLTILKSGAPSTARTLMPGQTITRAWDAATTLTCAAIGKSASAVLALPAVPGQ